MCQIKDQLIKELIQYFDETGKVPTNKIFERSGHTHPTKYRKEFGSWTKALEIAGFKNIHERRKVKRIKRNCLECGTEIETTVKENKRFCGRSCSNTHSNRDRVVSDETREKMSKSAKEKPVGVIIDPSKGWHGGGPNGPRVPRIFRKCRECFTKFETTQKSSKRYCSKKCSSKNAISKIKRKPPVKIVCNECGIKFTAYAHEKRKYCSTTCSRKNTYHPNSTRIHRSFFMGYQMDSGAELAFAKILNREGIKWIKNDKQWMKYFTYDYNGKTGKYYPDFYLPQFDMWVEIKGRRYIREGDEERRAAVPNGVHLIISNDMRKTLPTFIDYLKERRKGI